MPAHAIGERSGGEEGQQREDPKDNLYCQLQEEICPRDENIASMTAKMEAMMEQLKPFDGRPMLRASSTEYSQLEWAHNLMALSQLYQLENPKVMMAP